MRYKYSVGDGAGVSLFAVNKQIRLEALEVYLRKNHFVVPYAAIESSNGSPVDYMRYIPGRPENSVVREHLRSISIPFDFRSLTEESNADPINFHHGTDTSDEVESTMDLHNDYVFMLDNNIVSALTYISRVHPKLRRLQANVENATCRLECHRFVDTIFFLRATSKKASIHGSLRALHLLLSPWNLSAPSTMRRDESFGKLSQILYAARSHSAANFTLVGKSGILMSRWFSDETPSESDAGDSSSAS